jgi:hypothetical protein
MPQKVSITIRFQVVHFEYDNGVTLLDAKT